MSHELKITKEKQVIIKRNEGILKINDTHTYDTTLRGDIYLECILEDGKSKLTNYIFGFQEVNNCISCKPTNFIVC